MKKYIIKSALVSALAICAVSCSDDNNEFPPKPEQDTEAAPKVVSTLPEADVMNADQVAAITIEYNKPIYITPVTTISVNGEYIDEGIEVDGTRLTIPYRTLPNTRYTVTIANPTVRDEDYNFSPSYTFSFTVKGLNILDPGMFAIDEAPVNPSATPEAVKLYQVLKENFGTRIISGAVAGGCHDTRMANVMRGYSGKLPVINCFDYMEHYQCAPVNPKGWSNADYTNTTTDENWAKAGGIVSYQWHWQVPMSEEDIDNFVNYAFYCNGAGAAYNTDFSAANALKEGTWENRVINRDLDAISGYLLGLQAKGIPVLWRPLHEAAGNAGAYAGGKAWFWWGNSGAETYKELWVYMFEYFKAKGVNNLVWVWTSCGNDPEWYPGDAYVDVIGVDYYESDPEQYHGSLAGKMGFLLTLSNHKVLALSECGALPSVDSMVAGGDVWSYAIPWNGQYTTDASINSPEFFREFLNHELVLTRDEMTPIVK